MSESIEDKLAEVPVVNVVAAFLQRIKLPGLEGLSLYDLLELYTLGIAKGAITTRASAIAFNFFTAIFPFLLFVLILIPYIPITDFKSEFQQFLNSVLPLSTSEFFFTNIFENIDNKERGGLLSSTFLLSIVLMANGVNAVFAGFESSYHEQLSRHFFKQYMYALSVALILALLSILSVAFWGYFHIYMIGKLETIGTISEMDIGAWFMAIKSLFFIMMIYISTATLYYFGTREGKQSRFFSIGAVFTTLLIILTSYLFRLYIANFSNFNELYGSIGALLILLAYLWLNSNLLILGYELNASLNRLKKRL